MATLNLFGGAKAIAPKKPTKGKSKDEIQLKGLKQVAEIDALIKALTAAKTTLETSVKSDAFDHFFAEAQATAKRPENFRGVDGTASASIEMRKRSTASALSEEEVVLLETHNLTVEKAVSVPQLFGINPNYATDNDLLAKVETALTGIVPADFIVVQEEKFKYVVTDDTMDAAFKNKSPREVIEAITVMAIKPKLADTDITTIIDGVKTILV